MAVRGPDAEGVTPGTHTLVTGKKALTTVEASGLSLAGLAPTMAMALGTAFAASEAGGAAPLSYLLGFVGSLALGFVIVKFARRYVAAGIGFTYVREGFGVRAGFTAGWVYACAWMFGVAVNCAIATNSLVALFALHHQNVSWLIFFIPMIVLCAVINYVGIKPSVRAQVTLELGSMAALTVVMTYVLAKGGAHGLSLSPFSEHYSIKGWGGIGYGMIFGFSGFAGFEAAAALGRETRNPRRAIPRAVMYSLIGAGLFYVYITYALSIGYGVKSGATWAVDPTPLNTIANKYAGSTWAQTIDALVAISGFSGALGIVMLSSRIFYDMGRGGIGVPWLVKLHERFNSPTRLVLIICSVALVTGVVVGEATTPATIVGFIGSSTTLGLILVYFAIALAGLRNFNTRESRAGQNALVQASSIVLPIVAMGLLGFAFYSSVVPGPAFPYNLAPYMVVLFALIGLTIYWRAHKRGVIDPLAGDDQLTADRELRPTYDPTVQ
jgi:amino acid transporter